MTEHIAATIYSRLVRGESIVLAKITRQEGSAPRTAGTQMVVTHGGENIGTIGGGLLEAMVIEQCAELLSGGSACFRYFDLGRTDIAAMDMICGGGLEVLMDPLASTPENIVLFDRWCRMAAGDEEGFFIIVVRRSGDGIGHIAHGLIDAGGCVHGHLPLTPAVAVSLARACRSAGTTTMVSVEQDLEVILEPIRKPKFAIILGAGHVAQPTAHFAAQSGFRVAVLDDRSDFANTSRFPDAHEVRVLADFEHAFEEVHVDRDSFIIIVTRGHLHDKVVLAQALRTNAGYIGMIGSRRKRDVILGQLVEEGFTREDLKRIHSPIGLDIGAQTPVEIAVSIVAEMIAKKNVKSQQRMEHQYGYRPVAGYRNTERKPAVQNEPG